MAERIVLVHGSVVGGRATWSAQAPLAARFELHVVERPGFPPGPPVERIDFEEHAQLLTRELRPGDHLVGHSYGVVVSLLAAALGPERLRSQIYLEAAHRLATAAAIIRSLDDLTPEVLAGGDCD